MVSFLLGVRLAFNEVQVVAQLALHTEMRKRQNEKATLCRVSRKDNMRKELQRTQRKAFVQAPKW